MIDLFQVAQGLQEFCTRRDWRFCFIGGLALQRWGEPRVTKVIDLTLLTGFGGERPYIDGLLQRYPARIADAEQFALNNRVLLLESASGVGIDVALGGLPFEERLVNRATPFEFLPKISLLTCSAEDLVVLKAFADRPRDGEDVAGIVIRQESLNWDYIRTQLRPLVEVKQSPHILERLSQLQRERYTHSFLGSPRWRRRRAI